MFLRLGTRPRMVTAATDAPLSTSLAFPVILLALCLNTIQLWFWFKLALQQLGFFAAKKTSFIRDVWSKAGMLLWEMYLARQWDNVWNRGNLLNLTHENGLYIIWGLCAFALNLVQSLRLMLYHKAKYLRIRMNTLHIYELIYFLQTDFHSLVVVCKSWLVLWKKSIFLT